MKRISEIPNDKPVVVYCRTGVRSKYATSYLKKKGYNPINVLGGIMAWISEGNDVSGNQSKHLLQESDKSN